MYRFNNESFPYMMFQSPGMYFFDFEIGNSEEVQVVCCGDDIGWGQAVLIRVEHNVVERQCIQVLY